MKMALVHDHLTQNGGAEAVLRELQNIFPGSPTYTLAHDLDKTGTLFDSEKIKTSFIQKLPGGIKKFEWFLPLMPAATEHFDLSDYEIVLSSASAFAKGVLTRPETLHICYCHTPTRYLWTDPYDYVRNLNHNFLVKKSLPLVLTKLRQWDRLAAERVNVFIANSNEVKRRIKKYYRRESLVIYPPVDTAKFTPRAMPDNFFLAGGRLVAYKRFDLLVQTFNRLGLKLKIFGDGPLFNSLRQQARANIEFLGKVDDRTKIELFEKCLAFLHPQAEDFGITAVEAMAAGRPVIAYGRGGALETVIDGETGTFFREQAWETLADTLLHFKAENFDSQKIREHALQFDRKIFQQKIQQVVDLSWKKFNIED